MLALVAFAHACFQWVYWHNYVLDESLILPEPGAGEPDAPPAPYAKAQFSKDFLEMWKRESDKCAGDIFAVLPIEGPTVSGTLKREAVEAVMRFVWPRIRKQGEPDALRENWAAIEKYAADLVDKVVAERWERVTAAPRRTTLS